MADQQNLLTAEPDLGGVLEGISAGQEAPAGITPDMAPGMAPGMDPSGGGLDLDQLLAEIDATESAPAPAPEAPSRVEAMEDMLQRMRSGRPGEEVEDGTADALASRLQGLEGQLDQLRQEKQMLAQQNVRDTIQSTITGTISDQLTKMQIDPKRGPGKAFARLVSNSAMVAVAKEQARTGNQNVDLKSVSQTVEKYSKLISSVATEIASQITANQRMGLSGGQKQPFTPSKAPGEMSEDEFDSAVMAAMKAFGS